MANTNERIEPGAGGGGVSWVGPALGAFCTVYLVADDSAALAAAVAVLSGFNAGLLLALHLTRPQEEPTP